MADSTGTSFPSHSLQEGHEFFNNLTKIKYRFLGGGAPSDPLNWMIVDGQVASDPDVSEWTARHRGSRWYNTTDEQFKGWNGSQIVLIG